MIKKTVDVSTGEVRVSDEGIVLKSDGIGSCVVITAYEPKKKLGAMAHVMLPGKSPKNYDQPKTKYAHDAINELLAQLASFGAEAKDLQVCLIGGGNVLKRSDDTICRDNIGSVTETLKSRNIKISAESLGGIQRRSAILDIERGCVYYTEGDSKAEILWEATNR